MKWREYINDEIDKTINCLNKAKSAIAEDDAFGSGIMMGRATVIMDDLNRNAYSLTSDKLDEEKAV